MKRRVHKTRQAAAILLIATTLTGPAMAQTRIEISSEWGSLTAELNDTQTARALADMLPLTLEMRDHLRQEKTGQLTASLPEGKREAAFEAGTLGLWGFEDFVIYYRSGKVPPPGIIPLGRVIDDVSIFDRPGPVAVTLKRLP